MAKSPQPPPGDDEPEAADAGFLFQDDAPRRPPAPSPPGRPRPAQEVDDYAVLGDEPEEAEPVPPVPIPAPNRPGPAPRPRPKAERTRAARVDQVWTRGAEWGPNLLLVAVVALGISGLVYLNLAVDRLGLLVLILAVGGAVLLVLSYPIVITLERPVRMTPEQAVRDFYTALSHHVPHYRRAWLLLSSAGRESPEFRTFAEFRAYWKRRLAQLRGGKGGSFTPVAFEIQAFKSEKSAGQTEVDGSYTVEARLRGQTASSPLASIRMQTDFVRGPDRMWYLNDGTLPERGLTAENAESAERKTEKKREKD
ncbi:MAG TPA: hypothetical protein VF590_10480 [Isosphaeraceae bacterium]